MSTEDYDEGYGQCVCGGAWFELHNQDDIDVVGSGPIAPPAVCIDVHGGVTGYSGKLVCVECGKDWDPNVTFKPTRGHLRAVE